MLHPRGPSLTTLAGVVGEAEGRGGGGRGGEAARGEAMQARATDDGRRELMGPRDPANRQLPAHEPEHVVRESDQTAGNRLRTLTQAQGPRRAQAEGAKRASHHRFNSWRTNLPSREMTTSRRQMALAREPQHEAVCRYQVQRLPLAAAPARHHNENRANGCGVQRHGSPVGLVHAVEHRISILGAAVAHDLHKP